MKARKHLENLIIDIFDGLMPLTSLQGKYDDPFEPLLLLEPYATKDFDIIKAERIESVIKFLIRDILSRPASGDVGRRLAAFQQRIGFLFKYKTYTIKCSTPLGYSIFFHNKAEGFSFQRHITHKTEAFHILHVKKGGYVFVCEYDDWQRIYDEKSFNAWLSGEPSEVYDKYKYEPIPGDLIVIDKLGTVHSVVGCVLEEYATASTDMVDRLHDQNAEKSIPTHFKREYAMEQLNLLTLPTRTRSVALENGLGHARSVELQPLKIRGGFRTILLDSFLTASIYNIEPLAQTEFFYDDLLATVIYISSGSGHLLLGDRMEVASMTPPALQISAGETALIAPGLRYAFANESSIPLTISEQRIEPGISLS